MTEQEEFEFRARREKEKSQVDHALQLGIYQ